MVNFDRPTSYSLLSVESLPFVCLKKYNKVSDIQETVERQREIWHVLHEFGLLAMPYDIFD